MSTITIEKAQTDLPQLIDSLVPGETVVITRNQKPIARLTGEATPTRQPRQAGNCKGMLVIVADDEEHLEDFAEYME
ncbi:MAG: type II toxin-antitoxin system Phd/YefM family antitoxin [Gemmatales bacterium]